MSSGWLNGLTLSTRRHWVDSLDVVAIGIAHEGAIVAGFARARVFETLADGAATVGGVATAVAVDPDKIVGSDRGGGKKFYFGAVK